MITDDSFKYNNEKMIDLNNKFDRRKIIMKYSTIFQSPLMIV